MPSLSSARLRPPAQNRYACTAYLAQASPQGWPRSLRAGLPLLCPAWCTRLCQTMACGRLRSLVGRAGGSSDGGAPSSLDGGGGGPHAPSTPQAHVDHVGHSPQVRAPSSASACLHVRWLLPRPDLFTCTAAHPGVLLGRLTAADQVEVDLGAVVVAAASGGEELFRIRPLAGLHGRFGRCQVSSQSYCSMRNSSGCSVLSRMHVLPMCIASLGWMLRCSPQALQPRT